VRISAEANGFQSWTHTADAGKREEAARLRSQYVAPLLATDGEDLSPQLAQLAQHIRESEREDAC
jgi:hypothetical protein